VVQIRVVIPVSWPEALEVAQRDYPRFARPDTEISSVILDERVVPRDAHPSDGFVTPEILGKIKEAERDGMDAVVIDCMADPGMEAGRKLVSIPVIGPGEVGFHLAATLGYKFSVVSLEEDTLAMEKLVDHYGLIARLASVQVMDCPLEQIVRDRLLALEPLVEASLRAVKGDSAHVIVPGCTATVGLAAQVQARLARLGCPVPVIEPPWAAVRLAESLVDMGLSHSKRMYPSPQ
jgi:allantoin racemase